jgi:hypothetical protein
MSPNSLLNSKKGTLFVIVATGISLYWTFTYSGPYRYLAELQLKWFGWYAPKLTGMVIVLGFMCVAGLIQLVLKGAERSVPASPTAPVVSAPMASVAPQVAGSDTYLQYVRYSIALVLFGIGAYFYYTGTHMGALQQLTAQDFLSGNLNARVVYADVRGYLNEDGTMSKDHYLYIPMTQDGNANSPLHLLVGVDEPKLHSALHREDDGTFTVRGVADRGLQADVKYAFEKEGMTVGEPCWVLHVGRDPSSDRIAGLVVIGIGVVFAGIIFGQDSYRRKKALAPRPLRVTA